MIITVRRADPEKTNLKTRHAGVLPHESLEKAMAGGCTDPGSGIIELSNIRGQKGNHQGRLGSAVQHAAMGHKKDSGTRWVGISQMFKSIDAKAYFTTHFPQMDFVSFIGSLWMTSHRGWKADIS